MKNRISFCVNACKKTTFRFIGGLQNVLRFLNSYLCVVHPNKPENIMKRLTAKEEEIMQMFWEHGPMFVRELLAFYEEPKPHYNTVSTLVRGLEEKGFVKYKAYGNTYQYYAAVSDKEYKRSALNDVVAQYYNNSYTNVVSTFIEEEGMSVDELKALIAEIESKKSNR